MIFALFLFNATLFALALINFVTIRHPNKISEVKESIQILLPVRNEEENIERILAELITQENLLNFKVLVIDDNSEDRTLELATRFECDRIQVISAPLPTPGWIGKVSALQAGYEFARAHLADVVISIDADVHFEPDAIARAVSTLNMADLDFISPVFAYTRNMSPRVWSSRAPLVIHILDPFST